MKSAYANLKLLCNKSLSINKINLLTVRKKYLNLAEFQILFLLRAPGTRTGGQKSGRIPSWKRKVPGQPQFHIWTLTHSVSSLAFHDETSQGMCFKQKTFRGNKEEQQEQLLEWSWEARACCLTAPAQSKHLTTRYDRSALRTLQSRGDIGLSSCLNYSCCIGLLGCQTDPVLPGDLR